MELDVPRAWFRLRVRLRPDGVVTLAPEDDEGHRVRAPRRSSRPDRWRQDLRTLPGVPGKVPVLRPDALGSMLGAVADRLERSRADAALHHPRGVDSSRAVVPVFVRAPRELRLVPWQPVVARLLAADAAQDPARAAQDLEDRWVVVDEQAAPEPDEPTTPFTLPLALLAVGDAGAEALAQLRTRKNPWISEEGPPRAVVTWADGRREASSSLATQDVDVLVVDADTAARLGRTPPARPVRLAVVLGTGNGGATDGAALRLPWCRSVLVLPGPPGPAQHAAVHELFMALSHDLPLHAALVTARRRSADARLRGSPGSLHDLRLTSAWEQIEREATALQGMLGSADLGPTLRRVDATSPVATWAERMRTEVVVPGLPAGVQPPVVPDVTAMGVSFAMEKHGLVPLAEAQATLGHAQELVGHLAAAGRELDDMVPTTQERVVNLGLRRTGASVAHDVTSVYAEPTTTLAAASAYALDVQIGARWRQTLVTGPQEPIDLLLPDSRAGHDLTVSVFTDTFTVEGPSTLDLHLPPLGASPMVSFALRSPAAPGPAWVRVSVYHRDNLVQTYRLRANVTQVEARAAGPVLTAELEHSSTVRWADLDERGPRALSVTVNDSGRGHRVFVKQLDVADTANLEAVAVEPLAERIRAVLARTVEQPATIDADEAVWALAGLGEQLRLAVFDRMGPDARRALATVANDQDLTIQVVRVDPQVGLPWGLVYDWGVPTVLGDDPHPRACTGHVDGAPCGHRKADGVVCVRGFWGVRHQVEELLSDSKHPPETQIPVRDGGVVLSLGVSDDATRAMVADLGRILPPSAVRTLTAQDAFVDAAFGPQHAGVVVVLGHYRRGLVREPPQDGIALATTESWLLAKDISAAAEEHGDWASPRPLVLLLACGSAAVAPTVLTSFLTALNGAAAGAIIGTECDIWSGLARDFTSALLTAMRGAPAGGPPVAGGPAAPPGAPPLPFGAAVQAARQELVLAKGDIRGLVFDALGPAEVTLV